MSIPLVDAICWFVAGMLLGGLIGWNIRIAYEARAAAQRAAEVAVEVEDLIVHDIAPEWDGHERRLSGDAGQFRVGELILIGVFIIALASSALGVYEANRSQQQAKCYTEINQEFAQVIEVRAVEAGLLERDAGAVDRQALDTLVLSITAGLDMAAKGPPPFDVRPALVDYRSARAESDKLRSQASEIRVNNPYPDPAVCN